MAHVKEVRLRDFDVIRVCPRAWKVVRSYSRDVPSSPITSLKPRKPVRSRAAAVESGQAGLTRPDRKADILLAAEKLFAQRGYHAVSIRQIAEEAGVPLALVGYMGWPRVRRPPTSAGLPAWARPMPGPTSLAATRCP